MVAGSSKEGSLWLLDGKGLFNPFRKGSQGFTFNRGDVVVGTWLTKLDYFAL